MSSLAPPEPVHSTVTPLPVNDLDLPVPKLGSCHDAQASPAPVVAKAVSVLQSPVSPLVAPTECAAAAT